MPAPGADGEGDLARRSTTATGDRFFWLSDIGWMMGPWTIIGNHNFGGTMFLYDGAPDCPRADRLWQTSSGTASHLRDRPHCVRC